MGQGEIPGRKVALIPVQRIERAILLVRGHRVILDSDLAALYGVPTKRLNEQVQRNRARFPPDFVFQLTAREATALRSQVATSKPGRGGRRYRPYVFSEHGALMAATVLNSRVAVRVSIPGAHGARGGGAEAPDRVPLEEGRIDAPPDSVRAARGYHLLAERETPATK